MERKSTDRRLQRLVSRAAAAALLALTVTGVTLASLGAPPADDAAPAPMTAPACGRKLAPCPEGMACKPDSTSCTDVKLCGGTCAFKNQYPSCSGPGPNPPKCDATSECRDDPRHPGTCGMACDKPGICVPKKLHKCAGFVGQPCPKDLYCYDDPSDGCDPKRGGTDCVGICL